MVAVAQLVEPWIVIPVVVGSSPISHPKYSLSFYAGIAAVCYSTLFAIVARTACNFR